MRSALADVLSVRILCFRFYWSESFDVRYTRVRIYQPAGRFSDTEINGLETTATVYKDLGTA